MNSFLDNIYYGNSLREYLIVLGIILLSILVLAVIKRIVLTRVKRRVAKTETKTDDYIVGRVDKFGIPVIQFAVIYWCVNLLRLSDRIQEIVDIAASIIITYFVLRMVSSIIILLVKARILRQEQGEQKVKQLGGLILIINIFIWIIGIVFLLDNWDKDVTAIVTGLGIGGIAIALAAQNILGDLFNYFVIFFDRPFEVGDFIIVDDKLGTVEYLGIKTTRLRSLSGEQIIIGNSNLTSAWIRNYKRMFERRVVFNINLDFRTPLEKVKIVPGLLKSIVLEQKSARFDRAHFAAYGDWSLRFEVVYYVLSPDYNVYMDIQQAINYRISEELKKNEIYFVTGFHISLAPQPENKMEQEARKPKIDPDDVSPQ